MRAAERAAAKAAGLKTYFTGTPCPRGHLAERYVSKGSCVVCTTASTRARRIFFPEIERQQRKATRLKRLDHYRATDRARRERNIEKVRRRMRRWRRKNPDYEEKRKARDIQAYVAFQLRNRFKAALRCGARAGSAVRDLGCTIPEFIIRIEARFLPGMTWDNHGSWHIDHVRPLSSFDLTDREQVLQACHWTNLQPLWAIDNLRKGARHG